MDQTLISSNESILFVGEGNFSFALSFMENRKYSVKHVTASCFEKVDNLSNVTLNNIKALEAAGAKVQMGVDATKLTTYPDLLKQHFSCIIFNFPHVGGKMKIHKNRMLLKNFFASSASLLFLSNNAQQTSPKIIVSLCKGQGGTPADGAALRTWGDSWQVVEMAALSGLVLTHVEPFHHNLCPGYSSVGYRSRERWFHTKNALVHVFSRSPPILAFPPQNDKESLVYLESQTRTLICERMYMEFAGFTEVKPGYFKQLPRDQSLEMSLFYKLYAYLLKTIPTLTFVCPSTLPIICDESDSQVPCILHPGDPGFLRSNFFEVISCYVGVLENVDLISYGPVFQAVGGDFSIAPARQQAVLQCSEPDKAVVALLLWMSDVLEVKKEDLNVKIRDQWTLNYMDEVIIEKKESYFVVELSTLAMVKYKLTGFRDLIEARICATNNQCILASMFPRTHVLDICFLESPSFDEKKLWSTIWRVLGHWIIDIKLLDRYIPKEEDWVSRCYRIWYRSAKEALSRSTAVNLHQCVLPQVLINAELALKVL